MLLHLGSFITFRPSTSVDNTITKSVRNCVTFGVKRRGAMKMTDFALRAGFSIPRNFTTQTSRKVSDTCLIEMNHSLTVFFSAQKFFFSFFFLVQKT